MIRAAGGILWRAVEQGSDEPKIEVALIHRPRYDDWSFPKGKLAPGESEVEGAIREVLEETGFRVRLGRPLGETRYQKQLGDSSKPKVVRYWAMQAEAGAFIPSREVDELRWVSLSEAEEMLSNERDKDILESFVRGPNLAGCVLLVRHGSAGSRSAWEGDDRLRPLDDQGWAQAEALVMLLSRFDVAQIISADYVRCVQTVKPLAEAIGLSVKEDPVFSENGYPGREAEAVAHLRTLGRSGDSTVVSSQGDVIPDLLQRLVAEDNVEIPHPRPKKGSVCALTFDGERVFSVEYFPPPAL